MFRVVSILGVILVALVGVSAAAGAQPERSYFRFSDEGAIPAGELCPFEVVVTETESGFQERFFGASGNWTRTVVHISFAATYSANGNTVVERNRFTRTIRSDFTTRDAGSTVLVKGPRGVVLHDAGQILYDASGIADVHGRHPSFEGADLCEALAA